MNDLDLVEFYVSADKSSTESENEGFPLTQLPVESHLARRQQRRQVLPAMTADRRAATLRAMLFAFATYITNIHPFIQ